MSPIIAKFLIPAIKIAAGGRCAPSVRLRGHGVHAGGLLRRRLSGREFIRWRCSHCHRKKCL